MTADRNFDDLVDKFEQRIYGTLKGEIRQAVLWQDLTEVLPRLPATPLTILDAGAGLGQLSQRLAALGHQLILCDISHEMLQRSQRSAQQAGLSQQLQFIHAPLQTIQYHLAQPVHLILCHAVVEWLTDPQDALRHLVACLAPGGILSLMFYNQDGWLLRNLLLGNIQLSTVAIPKRPRRSLQPLNPLTWEQITGWLTALQLSTIATSGVRVFSDYWHRSVQQAFDRQTVLDLEQRYCRVPSLVSIGRYIHCLAQKPH
jgi:S-adenosylmethionine-dependent methyltransferase